MKTGVFMPKLLMVINIVQQHTFFMAILLQVLDFTKGLV